VYLRGEERDDLVGQMQPWVFLKPGGVWPLESDRPQMWGHVSDSRPGWNTDESAVQWMALGEKIETTLHVGQ